MFFGSWSFLGIFGEILSLIEEFEQNREVRKVHTTRATFLLGCVYVHVSAFVENLRNIENSP